MSNTNTSTSTAKKPVFRKILPGGISAAVFENTRDGRAYRSFNLQPVLSVVEIAFVTGSSANPPCDFDGLSVVCFSVYLRDTYFAMAVDDACRFKPILFANLGCGRVP